MRSLVIVGKAAFQSEIDALKNSGYEIWMLGTDTNDGADEYFEFHGLDFKNRIMTRSVNHLVELTSHLLPLNNSISIMLVEAYFRGYKNILLLGCPMDADEEMKKQKASVSMVVGYLLGRNVTVYWKEAPERKFYLDNLKNV